MNKLTNICQAEPDPSPGPRRPEPPAPKASPLLNSFCFKLSLYLVFKITARIQIPTRFFFQKAQIRIRFFRKLKIRIQNKFLLHSFSSPGTRGFRTRIRVLIRFWIERIHIRIRFLRKLQSGSKINPSPTTHERASVYDPDILASGFDPVLNI